MVIRKVAMENKCSFFTAAFVLTIEDHLIVQELVYCRHAIEYTIRWWYAGYRNFLMQRKVDARINNREEIV